MQKTEQEHERTRSERVSKSDGSANNDGDDWPSVFYCSLVVVSSGRRSGFLVPEATDGKKNAGENISVGGCKKAEEREEETGERRERKRQ